MRASGFPVLTPAVDIANARIEFADGCVADVSASRVSQTSLRKLRIFQPDQYLSIDCENFHVRSVRKEGSGLGRRRHAADRFEEQQFQQADPLMAEIRAFAHAVRTATDPPVTGADGKRALEVALEVCRQMNLTLSAVYGTASAQHDTGMTRV